MNSMLSFFPASHNLNTCSLNPLTISDPFFQPSFYSANITSSPKYNEVIIVDDDDEEDIIMYEPVKKQKTELNHMNKPKNGGHQPQEWTKSARDYKAYKSSECLAIDGSENADFCHQVDDVSASLTVPDQLLQNYALSFNNAFFSQSYNNFASMLSSKIQNGSVPEYSKFDLARYDHSLIVDSQSPVSTIDSISSLQRLESTDLLEKKGIDENKNTLSEKNNKQVDNITIIPSLDTHTCRGQRVRRTLRVIWNPEFVEADVFDKFLTQICQILGQTTTNEEKAVKLLATHGMDVEEALKEVKRNKAFYKNHFKSDHRKLRSRIPLF